MSHRKNSGSPGKNIDIFRSKKNELSVQNFHQCSNGSYGGSASTAAISCCGRTSKDYKCESLKYNYEYLARQAEINQEEEELEEEIEEESFDSEPDLENKIIPENYRDQNQILVEDAPELDEISEFDDIFQPKRQEKDESNIVEIQENSEELDILDDPFGFS